MVLLPKLPIYTPVIADALYQGFIFIVNIIDDTKRQNTISNKKRSPLPLWKNIQSFWKGRLSLFIPSFNCFVDSDSK